MPKRPSFSGIIHRIDLTPAAKDQAVMQYLGVVIGASRQPLFDAARWLLRNGMASEADRIETWRGKTKCLSGPVWAAAKLAVEQDRFVGYDRHGRHAASQG